MTKRSSKQVAREAFPPIATCLGHVWGIAAFKGEVVDDNQ